MNDDFLRRLRRPPSAAFERQLRERLRQQELSETSRRRPNWKLLAIPLLVAGTALATATYLTMNHAPWQSSSVTRVTSAERTEAAAPAQSSARLDLMQRQSSADTTEDPEASTSSPAPLAQPERLASGARESDRSSTDASPTGATARASGTIWMPGMETSTLGIRIVVTPDLEAMTKDTLPRFAYNPAGSLDVDSADAALRALCSGAPEQRPEIVITSRRILPEELKVCNEPGLGGVLEATLGHAAVVITGGQIGTPLQLSRDAVLRAILKRVPSPDDPSQLIDNPYTHWNQINRSLEDRRIEVLGPARNAPEFVVFAAALLEPACDRYPSIQALQTTDRNAYEQICYSLREDGVYKEVRFDSTLIQQRLWSDPNVVAVMDYPFYSSNSNDLLGSFLPGAAPTRESIVNESYGGARTLHFYVSRSRYERLPRLSLFVNEYLRLRSFARHRALTPPDVDTEWWRYSRGVPLTEVKSK